jgi:hypothetical protein
MNSAHLRDLDEVITTAFARAVCGSEESARQELEMGIMPILVVAPTGTYFVDVIEAGYRLAVYRTSSGLRSEVCMFIRAHLPRGFACHCLLLMCDVTACCCTAHAGTGNAPWAYGRACPEVCPCLVAAVSCSPTICQSDVLG